MFTLAYIYLRTYQEHFTYRWRWIFEVSSLFQTLPHRSEVLPASEPSSWHPRGLMHVKDIQTWVLSPHPILNSTSSFSRRRLLLLHDRTNSFERNHMIVTVVRKWSSSWKFFFDPCPCTFCFWSPQQSGSLMDSDTCANMFNL